MSDTLSKIEKRTAYTLLLPAVFLVFSIILFLFLQIFGLALKKLV